jgi:PIN domain nuclease of toxin-antitoxin system
MSAFLLDTHTFIWLTENNARLPDNLRDTIDNADLVYVSMASLWEIAIKLQIGKLSLQRQYETIESIINNSDILILPISFADTIQISILPSHHGDPFDRMLIVQAINRSLVIVSTDEKFDLYAVQRIWE